MKKLTKYILPLLFALFTMGIVMNVSAATWQGDGYTLEYVAEGNLAAITGCSNDQVDVKIPAYINGCKVFRIGNSKYSCSVRKCEKDDQNNGEIDQLTFYL